MKRIWTLICLLPILGILYSQNKTFAEEKTDVLIINKANHLQAIHFNSSILREAGELGKSLGRLHALLIVKDNHLVFEKYFNEFNRDKDINVKSVTKTVMASILGIAVDKGYIHSIDETIDHFFAPELKDDTDSRKATITLRHLLSMTPGLECASPGGRDDMQDALDWARFVFGKKLLHTPGAFYEYSTGNMHLISVAIARGTGQNTFDFACKYLFEPLGITIREWQRDPQGIPHGGNNLYLKPIDMAKFGLLFLQKGRYNGKQILSPEWVESSISLQYDPGRIWSPFHFNGLGYMWWLFRISKYNVPAAWGHGGQFIFIVPDLNLVVVMASSWDEAAIPTPYYRELCRMMEVFIIPAFEIPNQ